MFKCTESKDTFPTSSLPRYQRKKFLYLFSAWSNLQASEQRIIRRVRDDANKNRQSTRRNGQQPQPRRRPIGQQFEQVRQRELQQVPGRTPTVCNPISSAKIVFFPLYISVSLGFSHPPLSLFPSDWTSRLDPSLPPSTLARSLSFSLRLSLSPPHRQRRYPIHIRNAVWVSSSNTFFFLFTWLSLRHFGVVVEVVVTYISWKKSMCGGWRISSAERT